MSDLSSTPTIPALPPRGWTPEARVRFLEHLASKGNVRAACARVGLSAEAAYRLRRRDPLFARGWAAATVMARAASEDTLATRALDGVEEPVFYRGEQVGVRQRYDTRLLLAHLARLDRMVEQGGAAVQDAGRFDELLALIAGEAFPEDLAGRDAALPVAREEWGREAAEARLSGEPSDGRDDAHDAAYAEEQAEEQALWDAAEAARWDAEAHWDAWFAHACQAVDRAGGSEGEAPPSPASFPRRREPGSAPTLGPRLRGDDEGECEDGERESGDSEKNGGTAGGEKASREDAPVSEPATDSAREAQSARYPAGPVCAHPPEIARIGAGLRTVSTVSTSARAGAQAGAGHPGVHVRLV